MVADGVGFDFVEVGFCERMGWNVMYAKYMKVGRAGNEKG